MGLLCVDHDHVSGHVRGLLCGQCNAAVGLLLDDPQIINRAADYVARGRQLTLFSA
jgi:Autographiviridae endonuclease VII